MFSAAFYAPQEDSNNKGTYIYSAWTGWVPHRNEKPKIKINIILFPSRILGNRKAYNLHHWTMRIHNHTIIWKKDYYNTKFTNIARVHLCTMQRWKESTNPCKEARLRTALSQVLPDTEGLRETRPSSFRLPSNSLTCTMIFLLSQNPNSIGYQLL